MWREAILTVLQRFVTFASLVQNNINNFVLLTDVFCWLGHELVDNLAEQANVSSSIAAYVRHKFGDGFLMLNDELRNE